MMTTSMMLWALKGSAVLACGALVNLLLGRAPASLRHLVWTAALAAALALPALQAAGFGPRISVPAWWPSPAEEQPPLPPLPNEQQSHTFADKQLSPTAALGAMTPGTADAPVTRLAPGRPMTPGTVDAPVTRLAAGRSVTPTAAGGPAGPAPAGIAASEPERPERPERVGIASSAAAPWFGSWPDVMFTVWLAGALALLGGTLLAHVRARHLTGRLAWPAPPGPRRLVHALATEMDMRTRVRLVLAAVPVPATWGLRGATVVLPEGYDAWSAATLRRVLLHELAHIQRRDCLSQLLGDVARAFRWYDPLAWLAVHRQRVESERACDDRVLAHGAVASAYAEDLLQIGRALRSRAALPPAALAMARTSRLGGRIRVILDAGRPRGRVGRMAAASIGTAALGLASCAAGLTPVAEAHQEVTARDDVQVAAAHEEVRVAAAHDEPVGAESSMQPPVAASSSETLAVRRSRDQGPAERWSQDQGPAVLRSRDGSPPRRDASQDRVAGPSQSRELCVFREDGGLSTSIHMDDDVTRIRWETDSCRVDIDMEGEVGFTSDDTGVARMADGALFEVEERTGGDERRVRFEGGAGGTIERQYWVNGDETPWGPEAERWVAQILPELFRHTTINAEARVRRMLDEGGPSRVFTEIGLIRSDHVASTYLELLMEQAELSEAELVRVIEFTGEIESDHTSANLLLAVVERAGLQAAFQEPLLRAAAGLESDHEKGRVLGTLLESPDLSSEQLDAVVRSAASIESDHGLSEVLATVARQERLSAAGRASFMEALGTIESDHNHGAVVNAFLDAGPLTADEVSGVLALTRGIESDHERSSILQRVASEYDLSGPQVASYLEAAREIESDHEAGATAAAVIEKSSFSTEQLGLVLSLAEGIASDHEMAGILQSIIRRRALDEAEVADVVGATARLGSDHQRSTTLMLMAREQELSGGSLLAVIESAAQIESDHNQSEVLLAIAERYAVEGRTLERYRQLAEGLSRSQRDRVLAALVR